MEGYFECMRVNEYELVELVACKLKGCAYGGNQLNQICFVQVVFTLASCFHNWATLIVEEGGHC